MIYAFKLILAFTEHYGDETRSVRKYLIEDKKKTLSINNLGSIIF